MVGTGDWGSTPAVCSLGMSFHVYTLRGGWLEIFQTLLEICSEQKVGSVAEQNIRSFVPSSFISQRAIHAGSSECILISELD